MKRFFMILITGIFVVGSSVAVSVDQTLAVVNGEPIFASEFNSIFLPILERYKQNVLVSEQSEQKINQLKDEVLSQKINDILLKQEVKKQKIKIVKKEIQDAVNEVKRKFANESEFNAGLKRENITISELEKALGDQLAIIKLFRQSLENKIKMPTEIEVKALYDKIIINMKGGKTGISSEDDEIVANITNELKRMFGEQIRLRQIFISCPKDATVAQIKAAQTKVATVKRELHGQTFADVASQYSEDPVSKPRNGDLGIVAKGDLPLTIDKTVFAMKVGDYTKEPIKTDAGYYFIKVEEKRAKRDITFDGIKNDLTEILYKNNVMDAQNEYVNGLKSKTNIKINKNW
ncbi:MAG: SurA N-terminal domain-containing protein [Endomicrobium sp.]|jgi:parvulin-like peptidyl-prolyl isomerase|nr:SurA N-terminal domain-containing protein [Endomicrobium sp.]